MARSDQRLDIPFFLWSFWYLVASSKVISCRIEKPDCPVSDRMPTYEAMFAALLNSLPATMVRVRVMALVFTQDVRVRTTRHEQQLKEVSHKHRKKFFAMSLALLRQCW